MSISNSKGVNKDNCNGVNGSNGVNWSDGVNGSFGVNWSNGVNGSNGVNWSFGVNGSFGVNRSFGVNWSDGVNRSNGVNGSFGVLNSFGVDKALFLADKKRTFTIFGKEVSEERFDKVMIGFRNKLDGWYPKFNNAFELYLKAGNDWKKVDASDISPKLDDDMKPYEAWKDMPKKAIEYLQSILEFDADIFKRITGIDVGKSDKLITLSNGAKISEQTVREALEFISKSNNKE